MSQHESFQLKHAVAPTVCPVAVEQTEPTDLAITVVAWDHTPEHNTLAADAVRDCAVVAMECAFRNDEQRATFEEAATTFVSTAPEAEIAAAKGRIFCDGIALSILGKVQRTDKRITTFDVNKDAPEIGQFYAGLRKEASVTKEIHYLPSRKAKGRLREAASQIAQSHITRELKSVSQLESLAAQYKGKDVAIGVLIGANHTSVYHALSRRHPAKRRYAQLPFAGQQPRERIYYPPTDQMRRHNVLLPGVDVPEGIANRAILHITQLAAARKRVAATYVLRARRVENLSDAEVSELVVSLDGMKSGVMARLWPKRTLAKMDAAIEARLIAAEKR